VVARVVVVVSFLAVGGHREHLRVVNASLHVRELRVVHEAEAVWTRTRMWSLGRSTVVLHHATTRRTKIAQTYQTYSASSITSEHNCRYRPM